MNEHARWRELAVLAAAGALTDQEERELATHTASCKECAADLEGWNELGSALRRLPTPQAPAALVERTQLHLAALALQHAERRHSFRVMAWLILFGWTTTVAAWPVVRLVMDGAASWLDFHFVHQWYGLVGFTAFSWLSAGVAAAVLGLRHRQERRLA